MKPPRKLELVGDESHEKVYVRFFDEEEDWTIYAPHPTLLTKPKARRLAKALLKFAEEKQCSSRH